MGRATERHAEGKEEEEGVEKVQGRIVRRKIYKYGFTPAKCLWHDTDQSARHSSLSDGESN